VRGWRKEALIVAAFYAAYSLVRNRFGSALVAGTEVPTRAFANAMGVIRVERWLGSYHEETLQELVLPHLWLVRAANVWYGTTHFLVTLGAFVALYLRRRDVFALWRNVLAAVTAIALVGFMLLPVMPPRLLDAPCPPADWGGACIASDLRTGDGAESFGFVDTIRTYGGPWAFDRGAGAKLSNQFAAMPSLHVGWALWCVMAWWRFLRRRAARAALVAYPIVTSLVIVVTANHFWLDALGGAVAYAIALPIGVRVHAWRSARAAARAERAPGRASTLRG